MMKPLTLLAVFCLLLPASPPLLAHSARATLDPAGGKSGFMALARITCFDDGSGAPASLYARVRDNSAPVSGLLISLQVLKGTQVLGTTDRVSGDANYSDAVQLNGGPGVYTLMLDKTAAGARDFDIEWHCLTKTGDHTGTDIIVDQFQ